MSGYFIVRNNYPAVALVKLHGALLSKGSLLREYFKLSDLRLAYYLNAMIARLSELTEHERSPTASRICSFFLVLRTWYEKVTSGEQAPKTNLDSQSSSHQLDHIMGKLPARGMKSLESSGLMPTVVSPPEPMIDSVYLDDFNSAIFTAEELSAMSSFMDMDLPNWNMAMT